MERLEKKTEGKAGEQRLRKGKKGRMRQFDCNTVGFPGNAPTQLPTNGFC